MASGVWNLTLNKQLVHYSGQVVCWQEGIRENGKIIENSCKLLWGLEIGVGIAEDGRTYWTELYRKLARGFE
jgi:hypothetical protein